MDDTMRWTPIGGTLHVLGRPAVMIAGLVLLAVYFSRSFLLGELVAQARAGNVAMLGMAQIGMSIVTFILFAVVHFVLSRQLAGPEDGEGEAGYGAWIGLMLLYFFVSQLTASMAPIVLTAFGFGYAVIGPMLTAVMTVVRIVFFPVVVYLAGQAYDAKSPGFGAVSGFLAGRGLGWFAGYVLLCLAASAITFVLPQMFGTARGIPSGAVMAVSAAVAAFTQLLAIAYAIAAFRAATETGESGPVF